MPVVMGVVDVVLEVVVRNGVGLDVGAGGGLGGGHQGSHSGLRHGVGRIGAESHGLGGSRGTPGTARACLARAGGEQRHGHGSGRNRLKDGPSADSRVHRRREIETRIHRSSTQ